MKDQLELSIKGINCDNGECNFRDDEVKFENYKDWLNKACPECGENLLITEDYNKCLLMIKVAAMINERSPKRKDDDETVAGIVDFTDDGIKIKVEVEVEEK